MNQTSEKISIGATKRLFYSIGIPTITVFDQVYEEIWLNMQISKNFPILNNLLEATQVENANLLIIGGYVNRKQIAMIQEIYSQMAKEKWVLVLGNSAMTGGIFQGYAGPSMLKDFLHVDYFLPGDTPYPSLVNSALCGLVQKIRSGELFLRD